MKRILITLSIALLPFAMQGGVVKGRVTAEGKPVAGVQVSDGRQIVLTNVRGRYRMKTDKADSVVFI
ncbi:MAG: metallophosphoesterase, partial [Bacteroidales bacterium]|nr:metallophosphoesterase [Bacteroidales bacterium]